MQMMNLNFISVSYFHQFIFIQEFKGKIATQMPELTPCFEYFFETGKRIVSLINTCDLEETLERKM